MKAKGTDASPQNVSTQGEQLARAVNWIVNDEMFANLRLHGKVKWAGAMLVRVAVLWVWSSKVTLVNSAQDAIAKVAELFGASGIQSYQVLTEALKKYAAQILPLLEQRMHKLMQQADASKFRIGLWLVLAVDGSRINTPRTEANERFFCKQRNPCKKYNTNRDKKKNRQRHAQARQPVSQKSHYDPQPVGPQAWLTLLWHVGLRMPWAWKIGPSYSSERSHTLELLERLDFPENTLICGDAGFVGYEFWAAIDRAGVSFLCRVGSNCRFLKKLGRVRERDGIVYCWPKDQQQRKQSPLVLRLLRFHDGRGEVYLVTNELNPRRLSDSLASQIYRKRWGVEVQFRTLKQTFGRSKLKAKTPEIAVQELHWSLMGLWMAQLIALREQTKLLEPDAKTSMAMVLEIIADILQRPDLVPARGLSLSNRLAGSTTDQYERTSRKRSRNYPRRKEEPRTGPPIVTKANSQQKKLDRELQSLQNAA